MGTHSLVPMPSRHLVFDHLQRGKAWSIWIWSGTFSLCDYLKLQHLGQKQDINVRKKCGLELEKIQGMLTIHFSFINKDSLSWRLFPPHLHWSFQEGTSPYDYKTITMNLGEEFRRIHNIIKQLQALIGHNSLCLCSLRFFLILAQIGTGHLSSVQLLAWL